MSDVPIKVVKIRPYPISVLIFSAEGAQPVRCKMLKLTPTGFIARTPIEAFFKVSNEMIIEFDVPLSHVTIKSRAKVIKFYNRIVNKDEREHLVEMHFKHLSVSASDAVEAFLDKIGQK